MKAEQIGGTYWAAGWLVGQYPLSVEPARPGPPTDGSSQLLRRQPAETQGRETVLYRRGGENEKLLPRRAAERKVLPAGTVKTVYDLGRHAESYHYSNDGSEYRSESVEDGGRQARKIIYKHRGQIAWVGVGLYFGSLDCNGYTAFKLAVRAEKPCKLEVKAYHSDKAMYRAVFPIGDQWQELAIGFDELKGADGSFDPTRKLLKSNCSPAPTIKAAACTWVNSNWRPPDMVTVRNRIAKAARDHVGKHIDVERRANMKPDSASVCRIAKRGAPSALYYGPPSERGCGSSG